MNHFRHPMRSGREPFGRAALIVAVIALIAAISGVAYAAVGLNGKQKKEVKSIAKTEAKKVAIAGPAGPPGAAGANGKDGAPGSAGKEGVQGKEGKAGLSGFTATLPAGKTETGTWTAFVKTAIQETLFVSSISYSIPLGEPSAKAIVLDREETEESVTTPVEGCEYELESPPAVPVAPAGTLCVFTTLEEAGSLQYLAVPGSPAEEGDSPAGTLLAGKTAVDGTLRLSGVWAVTAE